MEKLRLSIVHYLNALPLSWGFIHGNERDVFELDFSPPSRCADLLSRGDVDIGLIPAIEYQRIAGLKIVPGLSVASKHRVRSVLLLSKVPLPQIRHLAADSSSRTSVTLLRILLRCRFKIDPVFDMQAPNVRRMLERHDAALLIGDVALKAETKGLLCLDLAEEWHHLTGQPFVFAFWGVRGSERLPDVKVFQRSYEYGIARRSDIVADQSRQLGLPEDLIRTYINENVDYSLDEANRQGLRLFYQLAKEVRLIDSVRELEFV